MVKLAMGEYDRHTLESGEVQDEAFQVTADRRKKTKDKKHDIKCDNRHKNGHTKAERWAKSGNEGEGMRRQGRRGCDKSNVATIVNQMPDIEAWTVIVGDEEEDATPSVPVTAAQDLPQRCKASFMIRGHRAICLCSVSSLSHIVEYLLALSLQPITKCS